MLVFAAIAMLFFTAVVRALVPSTPRLFDTLSAAFLLAQPALTLRLVARLRRVPVWLTVLAVAGWVASAALLVRFGFVLPPGPGLVVVLNFVATELVAALYF